MKQRFQKNFGILAATAAAFALTISVADPAAAQGGRGGQGGFPGGGGFGGGRGGQRMGRPPMTIATAPVTAMTPYFGLTEEQAKKIEEIQKGARPDMQAMFAGMQEMRQSAGENPSQQDREAMRAKMMEMRQQMQEQMQKTQVNQEKAVKEIELVLTPEQRAQITSFLRDVELFRQAELPLELIKPLDLNGPQKRKLQTIAQQTETERREQMQKAFQNMQNNGGGRPDFQAIGKTMQEARDATRQKVLAVLTTEQRTMVTKWEKDNPQQRGGFGGFGGPGGPGGFGGGFGGPGGGFGGAF